MLLVSCHVRVVSNSFAGPGRGQAESHGPPGTAPGPTAPFLPASSATSPSLGVDMVLSRPRHHRPHLGRALWTEGPHGAHPCLSVLRGGRAGSVKGAAIGIR